MLQETIDIIKGLVGSEYLYFDTSVQVTKPPMPTYIWAVYISPVNELWVMDSYQSWFKIGEEKDRHVLKMIHTKMQEVKKNWKFPVHISVPLKEIENQLQQASQR